MRVASSLALALALALGLAQGAATAQGLVRVKRIVGGAEAPAPVPPGDADPVAFDEAANAWVFGLRRKGHFAFLGIRYAQPPVGPLRFQRPQRVWLQGEVDATRPPPPCPQPGPGGSVVGKEDCLFLNVFTPQLPSEGAQQAALLPVLVWVHGGGFRRGSAAQYGAGPLVRRGLVLVVAQYRLGSLGFLSAAAPELPGNAGLFDVAAALAWAKRHAKAFGGDPGRVVVGGQGAGAAAAALLALAPLTRGLVSGVLALSGSALSSFALDPDPLATARDLAARANCPQRPTLALVRCLQRAPPEALVQADSALQELRLRAQGVVAALTGLLGAAPVVEGPDDGRAPPPLLPHSPLDLLKASGAALGSLPPLPPLVTGVVAAETAPALYGRFRQELLQGIATVPAYVDHLLGALIQCTAPLVGNVTGTLLHTLATNYFGFLSVKDTSQALERLVEVTGDALFNLPAWTTAQWWSRGAPLYLYSFEHSAARPGGGAAFLQGLPLVAMDNTENEADGDDGGGGGGGGGGDARPGHGDDLPFAFDARPLQPPDDAADATDADAVLFPLDDTKDLAVQEHVTDFIAEFARSGAPRVRNASWPAFEAGGAGRHLRLSTAPAAAADFRACQMELWTGALARSGVPAVLCAAASAAAAPLGIGLSQAAALGPDAPGVLTAVAPPPPPSRPPLLPVRPLPLPVLG